MFALRASVKSFNIFGKSDKADRLEKALRSLGPGEQIDRAEELMNQLAEQAASSAKPIFIRVITRMGTDDAFDILEGEQDAVTLHLMDESGDGLYDRSRITVVAALDDTGAKN
jgi:hypothetical protein